jgi:hypothetical protein
MYIKKQEAYNSSLYSYSRDLKEEYVNLFKSWITSKTPNFKEKKSIPQKKAINAMMKAAKKMEYISYHMKLIAMDIIINKSFSFKCIETNQTIRTKRCFHLTFQNEHCTIEEGLDDMIVYIFDKIDNPFFVCIGGGGRGSALCNEIHMVYYFKNNKLYSFNEDILTSNSSKIILCERILQYYNSNTIIDSDKICTTYGYIANMGHTYWNEMTAFKFLLDLDLLKFVDTFIIGPYDYYNLYDYLKKNNYNVIREEKIEKIDSIITNNYFLFKYNDFFMYEDLKYFVLENNKLNDETELAVIEDVKKKFYPIITFNIRKGYRYLNNQESSISNIINHLLLLFPNMYVIFDGYVKNKNVNIQLYSTAGFTLNEKEFDTLYNDTVNSIVKNINTQNIVSLIGDTLDRQLAWLNISDYGILQTGSGATNYSWVLNKKYIGYGINPIENDELLTFTYHDFYYIENKSFSTYIHPSLISFDVTEKKEFNLDWRVIFLHVLRDIMIIEKNDKTITQLDNFHKYNIYMTLGLGEKFNIDKFFEKGIYNAANALKWFINNKLS